MYPNSFRSCVLATCVLAFASVCAGEAPATTAADSGKALDAIKSYVADAANSGKKVQVWITAFGAKAELSKSDPKK